MTPSLLIITGWAHGPETLQPVADALANQYEVQIRTAAQVLNDQHLPDVDYIVSDSMGGLLAMELLPEHCKKLVLISSTAKFCADEGYPCGTPNGILRKMTLQLKRDPEAVLKEFYKNVHDPHPTQKTTPDCSHEELIAGLDYLRTSDVRAKVPHIGIPVLLLHGTNDRIIPSSASKWLHDRLPDSRLKLFPKGSHALSAHHFTEVISEITIFLELH